MDPIRSKIIDHFISNHSRILAGAMLPFGRIHPTEIVHIGEVGLNPSGIFQNSTDFTANFSVAGVDVSYFGTITRNMQISNEAITGRRSDGVS